MTAEGLIWHVANLLVVLLYAIRWFYLGVLLSMCCQLKYNPCQRNVSESAESYGSDGYFEKQIFTRMESKLRILQRKNQKWSILHRCKALLTLKRNSRCFIYRGIYPLLFYHSCIIKNLYKYLL